MMSINSNKIFFLTFVIALVQVCQAQKIPQKVYTNQDDYSFMWWKKTIKRGNQVFGIKTNNYSLEFDNFNLSILNLSINSDEESEEDVLRESNEESFPHELPLEFSFGLKRRGYQFTTETSSGSVHDCQLIETGKYFQRRFINRLPQPGMANCGDYNSGLEIASWADRLSFILKAIPKADLENTGAQMDIKFPSKYSMDISQGDVKGLKDPSDGSGFILLKSKDASSISLEGTKVRVILDASTEWPEGLEKNIGLIIYPIAENIDLKMREIVAEEAAPLQLTAEQIAPAKIPLQVDYDKDKGWHQISLRNDHTESTEPPADPSEGNPGPNSIKINNRIERVNFAVKNPSNFDRILRLQFAKGRLIPNDDNVFAVPGISAVLRDLDGNPTGIPIQLSKNWHTGGRTVKDEYFKGTWYHGYSVITIPASSSISLEYTSVNALWGGVPAASHAQLCLVGWGYNQQWDQAAIGAWGENITYEPDLHQAHAPVLDFRPLFLVNPSGKKWGWTGNIGGADFFNYTKTDGSRSWHSRIRTQYKKYSPNLTEVTYAGTMDDQSMDFEYTTRVMRSDDITRGRYTIKLKVLKETTFEDFVIFQAAAASYHQTNSETLAWGNSTGLKSEWKASVEAEPGYISKKTKIEGEVPWFSFTNSKNTYPWQEDQFLSANRGFVIRNWKARIAGVEDTPPWFAEYIAPGGNFGNPSALINIVPPDGCTTFKKGDYIEADIDLFIIPQNADEYYGPNQNLANALAKKANTWGMVYREAVGNDIDLSVSKGKMLDNYPIEIEAFNNEAEFSVIGGLGYVPLTITNIHTYKHPMLFEKLDNEWKLIDQSIHGNDFWQSEYNKKNNTWDITYNVNLDSKGDTRVTREFKFQTK